MTATAYSLADAEEPTLSPAGASFRWRGAPVELALAGRFNVANALAAGAAAEALGIEPGVVARGLSAATPVPGRFEAIDGGQRFTVLVDYAHKPDALEQALRAARSWWPRADDCWSCSAAAATATWPSGRSWARWRPGWPTT